MADILPCITTTNRSTPFLHKTLESLVNAGFYVDYIISYDGPDKGLLDIINQTTALHIKIGKWTTTGKDQRCGPWPNFVHLLGTIHHTAQHYSLPPETLLLLSQDDVCYPKGLRDWLVKWVICRLAQDNPLQPLVAALWLPDYYRAEHTGWWLNSSEGRARKPLGALSYVTTLATVGQLVSTPLTAGYRTGVERQLLALCQGYAIPYYNPPVSYCQHLGAGCSSLDNPIDADQLDPLNFRHCSEWQQDVFLKPFPSIEPSS